MNQTPQQNAIFAAYLNQAQHNLFVLMNNIGSHIGLTNNGSEADLKTHPLLNTLENPLKARQSMQAIKALNRSFVFIEKMQLRLTAYLYRQALKSQPKQPPHPNGKQKPRLKRQDFTLDPSHYAGQLKNIIEVLHHARNHYSHHAPQSPSLCVDANFIRFLEDMFDASVSVIKHRHNHEEANLEHLRRFQGRGAKANTEFDYAFKQAHENHITLTPKGLVFLTCLLLERKDAYEFLKQLKGFKNSETDSQKATLHAFTCFCIRMPLARLGASPNKESLAMDMLNELTRCPSLLYKRIHTDEQKKYIVTVEEDEKDSEENPNPPCHIRSSERYVPLMLSYFDYHQRFSGLRFALDMGNMCHTAYPKTLPTGDEASRRLMKKVVRFTRLNEALACRSKQQIPASWLNIETVPGAVAEDCVSPYIVQTEPHYHLPENNIAIRLYAPNKVPPPYPAIIHSKDDKGHDTIACADDQPHNAYQDFILSQHDLFHWAFYDHLHQKQDKTQTTHPLETLLQQYKAAIKAVYQDAEKIQTTLNNTLNWANQNKKDKIAHLDNVLKQNSAYAYHDNNKQNSTPLDHTHLPKPLLQYLLSQPSNPNYPFEAAQRTLTTMLRDNKKRMTELERIRALPSIDRRNKPGNPKQKAVQCGKIADFIARDSMRLMQAKDANSQNHGKPTSLIFSELQAHLAFYGRDKQHVHTMAESIGLHQLHPFWNSVFGQDHKGILSVYQCYLSRRQTYLSRLQEQIKQHSNKQALEKCLNKNPWLRRQQPQHHHGIDANTKLKAPLNLPRNLLHPFLLQRLTTWANQHCPALSQALQSADKLNASHMVQLYFEHALQDSYPNVYNLPRNYRLIDKVQDGGESSKNRQAIPAQYHHVHTIKKEQPELWNKLQTWVAPKPKNRRSTNQAPPIDPKASFNRMMQNERNIRQTRVQDQTLFLATQNLLPNVLNPQVAKLADMDGAILQTRHTATLHLHGKTITQTAMPIRKLGEFRRFMKDRRLPDLFTYHASDQIDRDTLRLELEAYQRNRFKAIQAILYFESQHPLPSDAQPTSSISRHHQLLQHSPVKDNEQNMAEMLVLRNAFFHNQYPSPSNPFAQKHPHALPMLQHAQEALQQQSAPAVSEYFLDQVHRLYGQPPERQPPITPENPS